MIIERIFRILNSWFEFVEFDPPQPRNKLLLCPLLDQIPKLDPHLYYYPWMIQHEKSNMTYMPMESLNGNLEKQPPETSYPIPVSPILVKSMRLLQDDTDIFHPNSWAARGYQDIWIHEGSPAVELSEEELAALTLFLGTELKSSKGDYLPSGRAGFGLLLSSNRHKGMTILRFAYGRQSSVGGSIACSGYSTFFAKHLACGCVPFAQLENTVHTLAVTPEVFNLIREGQPICRMSSRTWTWSHPANCYLNHMPALGQINYYHESLPVNGGKYTDGTLVGSKRGTLFMGNNKSCTWWEAVAGIAFGGLVPAATQDLVSIVAFSVGGEPDKESYKQVTVRLVGDDIKAFHQLMKLVMENIWQKIGSKSFSLFGESFLLNFNNSDVDYDGWVRTLPDMPMRDVVAFLSRYTTLLEALIATVNQTTPVSNENKKIQDEENPFKVGRRKREAVFQACVAEIREVYLAAVDSHAGRRSTSESERSIAGLLRSAIESMDKSCKSRSISVEDCGTVARCIIMLWTRLVKIIDWKQSRPRGQTEAYLPLSLEELPDVAAWK